MTKLDSVSISRKRNYDECEVSAFVFDKYRLGYSISSSAPMDKGSYVHKLLEMVQEVGKKVHELNDVDVAYMKVLRANPIDAMVIGQAYNIVQQYERFIKNTTHEFRNLTIVSIEVKFKNTKYSGVIDLILVDDDGYYYIADFKTSDNVIKFHTSILMDEQLQLYSFAAEYPIKGVYFIGLKSKLAERSAFKGDGGRIRTSKTNRMSYELFKELLIEAGLPFSKYEKYLYWLENLGRNNIIAYNEFTDDMLINTMERLDKARQHIVSLQDITQCKPTITYTCHECPIFLQCAAMQEKKPYNFAHLEKPEKKDVTFTFGSGNKTVDEYNEDLFG